MPITVVGSIAYDAVKTPFGERERMLGGAAVHFALAASFFDGCAWSVRSARTSARPSSTCCAGRGVDVSDIERVAGGETFFWRGEYGWDLNSRETLDTQLGVFEGFEPEALRASRASDVLFLANIQPDLQREVRAQLPDARFVALDSMNLWIDIARDSLLRGDRRRRLPDPQRRRAAPADRQAEPALGCARGPLLEPGPGHRGPSVIVAKQGEYGAALITRDGFFSLPAYPARERHRPDRGRGHVRRGLRRLHRRTPRP